MEKIQNFNASEITPSYKKTYNQKLFQEVSSKYDYITKILSCNQDGVWKRKLMSMIPEEEYRLCVDVACGTGDISCSLARSFPNASILGIDLSPEMLARAQIKNSFPNLQFSLNDMCSIPCESGTVDLLTGGYALRNAPDLRVALEEFFRVLKPGGIVLFLDFSKPQSKFIQYIYYHLLKAWGSLWGILLHRNPAIYNYIAESLRLYPDRVALRNVIQDVGFEVQTQKYFFCGMIEIILCKKKI